MTRQTSRIAWREMVESGVLLGKQAQALEAVIEHGPATSSEIIRAGKLGDNLNLWRARFTEWEAPGSALLTTTAIEILWTSSDGVYSVIDIADVPQGAARTGAIGYGPYSSNPDIVTKLQAIKTASGYNSRDLVYIGPHNYFDKKVYIRGAYVCKVFTGNLPIKKPVYVEPIAKTIPPYPHKCLDCGGSVYVGFQEISHELRGTRCRGRVNC